MPFNFTKKNNFMLTLTIGEHSLDVVYKTQLLGVIVTSNCKFSENMKTSGSLRKL